MRKASTKKSRALANPILKGYSLPDIAKHLPVASQGLMLKRGQLMMDLRANPLSIYFAHQKEIQSLLTVKERTAPLRAEVKSSVLASIKPKRGSFFPSEAVLTQLVENINSFSEGQLIDLLKKKEQMTKEQFSELVLNSKPRQTEFKLK
ncbi:MAG: hypothetical protein WCW44_04660 [archaeon]|jgi:hypothetical protein